MTRKPLTENAKSVPVDLRSDNPSENDRIHAATEVQSDVTPEDYPEKKRRAQVDAAGAPGKGPAPDRA